MLRVSRPSVAAYSRAVASALALLLVSVVDVLCDALEVVGIEEEGRIALVRYDVVNDCCVWVSSSLEERHSS